MIIGGNKLPLLSYFLWDPIVLIILIYQNHVNFKIANIRQKNVTVALGQPINLTCNAYGDPKPRVKWFHKIEEDSDAKVVAEDDNLYLPSASLLDSGM